MNAVVAKCEPRDRSTPVPWCNHLPAWIRDDAEFAKLALMRRTILQGMADAGDLTPEGHIVNIRGGRRLYARIRCSRESFFRHIGPLIDCGYVVCLGRGGVRGTRHFGNVYGLPDHRGALVGMAVREARRMVPDPAGQKDRLGRLIHRAEVIRPGTQPGLWPQQVVDNRASRRRAVRVGQTRSARQPDAPPSSQPSPVPSKDHGVAVRRGPRRDGGTEGRRDRGTERGGLPRFGLPTLMDTSWLLRLWAEAVRRRLVEGSDDGRLMFVAAAEHALRLVKRDGGDPVRVFASNVNNGRWLMIGQADEEAARRRLIMAERRKAVLP